MRHELGTTGSRRCAGRRFDRILQIRLSGAGEARRARAAAASGRRFARRLACLAGAILSPQRRPVCPSRPLRPGLRTSAFVADERLAPMVSFSPPEAIRAPLHYQARMRGNATERWDTLTFGEAGGDELLFRVTLRAAKSAGSALPRSSLFVDLAKQSAETRRGGGSCDEPAIFPTTRADRSNGPRSRCRARRESAPASGFASTRLRGNRSLRPCLRRPWRAARPGGARPPDRSALRDGLR